jgi:S-(hydroxymethyl)glutathione dehydrogenase / alcohol dehydrogenase
MQKDLSLTAIIKKKNKIILNNIKIPKLQKGQLLVEVKYSGICGSQLQEIKGLKNNSKFMPHMFGHEAVGKVILIHKSIKKVKINDTVILSWIKSNGIQAKKPFYKNIDGIKINSGILTTFSKTIICSENNVCKKPKQMSYKLACLFGCAAPTGIGMVKKNIKNFDKKIIVYGLGGVGLCSLIYLKIKGAKNVIAIDKDKKKIKIAKTIGFKKCLFPDHNLKKNIKKIFKEGADYCIESCGYTKTIENAFSFLNKKGKLIFSSHPSFNSKININPHDLISGKKIIGSWGGGVNLDKDLKSIFHEIKKKQSYFRFLSSKIYSFVDIIKAINDFKKSKVVRPILKM